MRRGGLSSVELVHLGCNFDCSRGSAYFDFHDPISPPHDMPAGNILLTVHCSSNSLDDCMQNSGWNVQRFVQDAPRCQLGANAAEVLVCQLKSCDELKAKLTLSSLNMQEFEEVKLAPFEKGVDRTNVFLARATP